MLANTRCSLRLGLPVVLRNRVVSRAAPPLFLARCSAANAAAKAHPRLLLRLTSASVCVTPLRESWPALPGHDAHSPGKIHAVGRGAGFHAEQHPSGRPQALLRLPRAIAASHGSAWSPALLVDVSR